MSAEFYPKHEIKADVWGSVTDPAEHDPANFRYLIHSISPGSRSSVLVYLQTKAGRRISYDGLVGDQSISVYHCPERLAERIFLSMSLIDHDHTYTWGEIGLIVGAPDANIVQTSIEDIGLYRDYFRALLRPADISERQSGDALLQDTDPLDYNEVIALGQNDQWQLRLEGFFYKTTPDGQPCDSARTAKMYRQALRLDLPLVAIVGHSIIENERNYASGQRYEVSTSLRGGAF